MRKTDDDFQRSLETLHRVFTDVLRSNLDMQDDYLRQPCANAPTHPSVREGTIYFPFKGALGAIDGTHVPAIVSKDMIYVHCNRKGFISQNFLAAVDFDVKFLCLCWVERVGTRYQGLACNIRIWWISCTVSQEKNRCRSAKDLFNHRHAQLRNVVERTFGVLKKRFKILTVMAPYKYKKQCRIVIACFILHNFLKFKNELQNDSDKFLDAFEEDESSSSDSSSDEDMSEQSKVDNTLGGEMLRTAMTNALWVQRQSQNQRQRNQKHQNQRRRN